MEPEDEPEMKNNNKSLTPDLTPKAESTSLLKNPSFPNVEVNIPNFEDQKSFSSISPIRPIPKNKQKTPDSYNSPSSKFALPKNQEVLPPWIQESFLPETKPFENNHQPLPDLPPWVSSDSNLSPLLPKTEEPPPWVPSVSPNPAQRSPNRTRKRSSVVDDKKPTIKLKASENLPAWAPKPNESNLRKELGKSPEIEKKLKFEEKNKSELPPWVNEPKKVVKSEFKGNSGKRNFDPGESDLPPWMAENVMQGFDERVDNELPPWVSKFKGRNEEREKSNKHDRPPWVSENLIEDSGEIRTRDRGKTSIKGKSVRNPQNENIKPSVPLESGPLNQDKVSKDQSVPPWFSENAEEINKETIKPARLEDKKVEKAEKSSVVPPWFSENNAEEEKPLIEQNLPLAKIQDDYEGFGPIINLNSVVSKDAPVPIKAPEVSKQSFVPLKATEVVSKQGFAPSKTSESSKLSSLPDKAPELSKPNLMPSKAKEVEEEKTEPPPWFFSDSNETKDETAAGPKGPPIKNINLPSWVPPSQPSAPPALSQKVTLTTPKTVQSLPPWIENQEPEKRTINLPEHPKMPNVPSESVLPPWMNQDSEDPLSEAQLAKKSKSSKGLPLKDPVPINVPLPKPKVSVDPPPQTPNLPSWVNSPENKSLIPKAAQQDELPLWFKSPSEINKAPLLVPEQDINDDGSSFNPPWIPNNNNNEKPNDKFIPPKNTTQPSSAVPKAEPIPVQKPLKIEEKNLEYPKTSEKIVIMAKKIPRRNIEKKISTLFKTDTSKNGFIQYGDVLCLSSKETVDIDGKYISYKGVITGDGISRVDLGCISKKIAKNQTHNIQFRQSLFRVEPARQYGFLNVYNKFIKKPHEAKFAKILKLQADEEEQGNEAEIETTTGQILTYGERIQLRHIHSNCFITISRDIANEHGALRVKLDYKGNENSWLEILPANKIRQEGEPVRYIDGFLITSKVEKSGYFIHMGVSTLKSEDKICEVNASEAKSVWKVKKYITVREQQLNPGSISTGDSFRILHKDSERYLSSASINIQTLLPEIELGKEANEEELASCVVGGGGKDKEVAIKYTEVILDKQKTSRGLWELERINPFKGGPSHLDEQYRLKNIATGMYLHMEISKQLSKNSTEIQTSNIFEFLQKESRSLLLFNTNLQVIQPTSGKYLGITENKSTIEKYFKGTRIEKFSEFLLQTYATNKKNEIQTTFVFEDESEQNSSHVYQISTILLSLVEVYEQINIWGFLKQDGVYYSSYKMAVDTEIELVEIVNKGTELLENLRTKILNSSNFFIKDNQLTVKDSGLLELLVKLLQLIDIKMTIPESNQSKNTPRAGQKFNVTKLFQTKTSELILCPQIVSRNHLRKLASNIFKTLIFCIKDNTICCEFVKQYNEFLGLQLMNYKTEVGNLLREIFKHAASSINESSFNEFQMWAGQLRSLNESTKNIQDQVLILKIISSLCTFQDEGMKRYQVFVNKFIFKNISMFIELREENNDVELKFLPVKESEEEFLRNNQSIRSHCEHGENELPFISVGKLNEDLTRYACAVVNLLATAGLSKNEKVIKRLKNHNRSITPAGLILTITNSETKVKVKTRFLYLLRVLFMNESSRISPKELKIIEWDTESSTINRQRAFPEPWAVELAQWIKLVWTSREKIFGEFNSVKEGLYFVIELVNITKVMIHCNFMEYDCIEEICPYLVSILSDNSNSDLIRLCNNQHWCCCLRSKASMHIELLQLLISKVLRLLSDISQVKLQNQIEFIIQSYQTNITKPQIERYSINFKVLNGAFFNMYLLNVMMSKFDKSIRNHASEQLVQIFNQQNFIKNEMEELILLYTPDMISTKERVYSCVADLKNNIDKLNLQVSGFQGVSGELESKKMKSLVSNILKNLTDLQCTMNMKGEVEDLKLGQSISRCLELDEVLLGVLSTKYPWVSNSSYKKRINKGFLHLYKAIFFTLSAYTFQNSINQESVYGSISLIMSFFENKIGVSRLMSHISSSQRTNSKVDHVIVYIFHLITQERDTPKHAYLKILKNLVIDENYHMYSWSQTNIVKSILKNESIISYYFATGSWNIVEYQEKPGLDFHESFISLLSLCAVQNYFVTLQCRNLVSFTVLEREICNRETPYSLKIAYLMFALNVFFVHVNNEVTAEYPFYELSEILNNVVIKDLQLYQYYLGDLIGVIQKFKFPGITKRKETLGLRPSISDDPYLQDLELTPDELEALAYWKYLLDTKIWKSEQSAGLLIFIKDFSIELKLSRFDPTDEFKMIILKISDHVQRLQAKMEGISSQNPRMNFDNFIENISLCWCEIPKYSFENEEENIQEIVKIQCYSSLLESIKVYLTENQMSLQDFFLYKLKVSSEVIPSKSLAYKLKTELRNLDFSIITSALSKVTSENKVMIDVGNFKSSIINSLGLNPNKAFRNITIVENLQEILFKQISVYKNHEEELKLFIKSIQEAILEKLLQDSEYLKILDFCNALFSALFRKKYQKYLFEIFTQFLKELLSSTLPKEQKTKRFELMNKALRQAGIGEIALYMVCEGNDLGSVIAAIEFLQTMFTFKNSKFSLHILSFFADPLLCFSFFSFIRNCIKDFQDDALNKSKGIVVKRFKSFIDNRKAQEVQMKVTLCQSALRLIELMCEQNPVEFQDLFRNQTTVNEFVVNVNIVSELTSLLISFSNFENNFILKKTIDTQYSLIRGVCIQTLKTLTSLCEGPCLKNQYEVGLNSKVYSFINWFVKDFTLFIDENNKEYIEILKVCIEFLSSLVEAELEPFIMKELLGQVDINGLLSVCYYIYEQYVSGKEKIVFRGDRYYNMWWIKVFESRVPLLNSFIGKIIGVGFSIFSLCLMLKESFPNSEKLKDLKYTQNLQVKHNGNAILDENFIKINESACNFYLENISKIEVNYKGSTLQIFFQRPFLTRFLTEKSRKYLLRNIGSFTYQAKIEEFFKRCKKYKSEMIYQQRLERYPIIAKFCSKWYIYKTVAFYLTCLINILLLVTLVKENGNITVLASSKVVSILSSLCALQIIFAFLSLLAYLFEYSPILYLAPKNKSIKKADNRIDGTLLVSELKRAEIENTKKTVGQGFLNIFSDSDVIYTVLYFLISFLAIQNYLWYGVLILDCIKRSQVLKNVLRSITLNYRQLLLTLILGIIITFIFSIIGFLLYSKDYPSSEGMYSHTLGYTFVSTLNKGVRAQGGIGDELENSGPWYSRILFDMVFFIVIIVVLLKVIFGIIVDTFAELRDMREQQIKNLEETCFVCGKNKFEFELRRLSWEKHVNDEHNVHAYAAFFIYIMLKKDDLSGIEKYLKKQVDSNQIAFFPKTSIGLAKFEVVKLEMKENYLEKFKGIRNRLVKLGDYDIK